MGDDAEEQPPAHPASLQTNSQKLGAKGTKKFGTTKFGTTKFAALKGTMKNLMAKTPRENDEEEDEEEAAKKNAGYVCHPDPLNTSIKKQAVLTKYKATMLAT